MRRDVLAAARWLIVPTVALGIVAAFLPGRSSWSRIYALILCAAVLGVALTALRRAYPLRRRSAARRARPAGRRPPPASRVSSR